MNCSHCGRNLAGVAVIFPERPPVCGRSDCIAWASAQQPLARVVEISFQTQPSGTLPRAA